MRVSVRYKQWVRVDDSNVTIVTREAMIQETMKKNNSAKILVHSSRVTVRC